MHRSISSTGARAARRAPLLSASRYLLAALLTVVLPAGCDNVACVFGPGNCANGNGGGPTQGVGSKPATLPVNGEWITSAAPKVTSFFPTGTTASKTTPIVMIFNESLAPTGINSAFEMTIGVVNPVSLNNVALVGDGRVVIALPQTPLIAGTVYTVFFRSTAALSDRVGRPVTQAADRMIGTFTTADVDPTTPSVLTSWPPDSALDQSTTTDAVVVFDRAMDASSVNATSFVVTVGGAPPGTNSLPTPVSGSLGLGPDTRAFRFRNLDAQGQPVSYGLNKAVKFALSPTGHAIRDTDDQLLPPTAITFTTAMFSAPTAARITSVPNDAIGINEISGPADLAIQVNLAGSQSGDFLGLYVFGLSQGVPINPPLAALFREVEIQLTPPATSFTMFAGEIDLLQSSSPLKARFADGEVAFAFQVRRGLVMSPMTLLDIDTSVSGVQSPVLDTVPPQLLGLGMSGSVTGSFSSNVREVTLIGRSTETLRGALLETSAGDNVATRGEIPAVTGTGDAGSFVVAPVVGVGVVPPAMLPLNYTLTLYDKALNASPSATGLFQQLGASGPGTPLPGGNVEVDVFDAATLAPIAGAEVLSYQNELGTVDPVAGTVTAANGHASVAAAPMTGMQTIITVIAPGYDLFTFDNVPTSRLGVPLYRNPSVPLRTASASGTLSTTSDTISEATKLVADSRVPEIGGELISVADCQADPAASSFACAFGPAAIDAQELGAQAALALIVPASSLQFSPATFLKGYAPRLPIAAAPIGGTSSTLLALTNTLDDPSLDPTELPVDGAPNTMLSLVNYPVLRPLSPDPRISMEAKTPGIQGSLTVGAGVAYAINPPSIDWTVRAAYPGAAEPIDSPPQHTLGRLAKQGTVEAPLMLRCEVTDPDGNIGGVRARLPFSSAVLVPPAPPLLTNLQVQVNPGFLADDLMFADVIPDSAGEPGIYRVTLTDVNGLSWRVYTADPPDSKGPIVIAHLPYVGLNSILPIQPGPCECQISAYAWPGFDISEFLWTDIEREHDLYSHAATEMIPYLP